MALLGLQTSPPLKGNVKRETLQALSICDRRQSNHTQNVMKTGDGTLVDLLLVRKASTAPSHTDGRFNNSRLRELDRCKGVSCMPVVYTSLALQE